MKEFMFQRRPAVDVILPRLVLGLQDRLCARERTLRDLQEGRTEVVTVKKSFEMIAIKP